jgi:hypothetical protein
MNRLLAFGAHWFGSPRNARRSWRPAEAGIDQWSGNDRGRVFEQRKLEMRRD